MKVSFYSKIAWGIYTAAAILLGISLILISVLPYDQLKPLGDSLAGDGNLESFTDVVHKSIIPALRWMGFVLILIGTGFLTARRRTLGWVDRLLRWLRGGWSTFWSDLRTLLKDLLRFEAKKPYLIALLAITTIALLMRLALVSRPFRYDEAYTFVAFALRPLRYLIADYHLPNNHVFHSVLVHFSEQLFGAESWAIRLPVLLAGVLSIPAVYLAAKSLYDRNIALLSAGFSAASWTMIDYSTNARGYMLIGLFSLLIFSLGEYLRRKVNLAAWFLVIVFSVLGFYTLPTMLYPFGMLLDWLFLSYLFKDVNPAYGRSFLVYLIVAVSAIASLTLLLYLPIFQTSGVEAVIGNRWVSSLGWEAFVESVPVRIRTMGFLWSQGLTRVGGILLILGPLLSLVFHRRVARQRVPTLLASILALAVMLSIQRVAPLAKVWLFLLPFLFIWTAAGILGSFYALPSGEKLKSSPGKKLVIAFTLSVVCLTVLLGWSTLNIPAVARARDADSPGEMEEAAIFLKDQLQPGDAVLVSVPVNYPLRVYLLQYGISEDFLYEPDQAASYSRILIVVDEANDQTLRSVVRRGKVEGDFDISSAKPIHDYRKTTIYEVIR